MAKHRFGDLRELSSMLFLQRLPRPCLALHIVKEVSFCMERKIRRGDMFYADLTSGIGSEQSGHRPVLIVSNDTGNRHSNTVIAAVITSRTAGKPKLPTHCPLKRRQGLGRDSLVLLEQIRTIDKGRLREFIGTLEGESMSKVNKALAISVGLKISNQ
jgi:mRNA interferase MazF